jgi:hypothetical protein
MADEVKTVEEPISDGSDDIIHLDWRLDPVFSHSDWTIEVTSKDTAASSVTQKYHVHRNILAFGSRKSGYFERVCRSGADFQETSTHTSRIELHKSAAGAVPDMLDFMYEKVSEKPLKIAAHSATALHSLGQYFDIRMLRQEALAFVKKDLSWTNFFLYYKLAHILQNVIVADAVGDFCANNVLSWNESIKLTYDYPLWTHVLRKCDKGEKTSHLLSRLIAHIVQQTGDLELSEFRNLTSANYIPYIHKAAALDLLDIEAKLLEHQDDGSELTSLQERCISTLSRNCQIFFDSEEAKGRLQAQGSKFLTALLLRSSEVHARGMDVLRNERENTKEKLSLLEDEFKCVYKLSLKGRRTYAYNWDRLHDALDDINEHYFAPANMNDT